MTVENIVNKIDRNLGRFLIIAETTPILGAGKGNFISLDLNDPRIEQIRDMEIYAVGVVSNRFAIYI